MISCMFPIWQHMTRIHGLLNFARSAPTKCVVSLHLTTQHRQVSMTSALRPENHLTYVSLISMNPRNEVLSCNRKIWISFPLALPAPKQPPVSSARWPHKKWFHSLSLVHPTCPSFPWPHEPKNVLDLLSLSMVSKILVGFAYFRLAVPTFL